MGFIERMSVRRRFTQMGGASPDPTPGDGTQSMAAKGVQAGLTSSRNSDRRGPTWQEAVGVLSWGALSLVAILFIHIDSSEEVFIAWVVTIIFAAWLMTAIAARTVRRTPTRHSGRNRGSRR